MDHPGIEAPVFHVARSLMGVEWAYPGVEASRDQVKAAGEEKTPKDVTKYHYSVDALPYPDNGRIVVSWPGRTRGGPGREADKIRPRKNDGRAFPGIRQGVFLVENDWTPCGAW